LPKMHLNQEIHSETECEADVTGGDVRGILCNIKVTTTSFRRIAFSRPMRPAAGLPVSSYLSQQLRNENFCKMTKTRSANWTTVMRRQSLTGSHKNKGTECSAVDETQRDCSVLLETSLAVHQHSWANTRRKTHCGVGRSPLGTLANK
jgi:hypothetical protein